MTLAINEIHEGDCLELAEGIESGSVDLILTDLPYGTVGNIGDSDSINHGMKGKTAWDIAIDPVKIYEIANRILRKNGKVILFSQEPYTTRLINEANPNVPFSYRAVWEKDHFANSLIAKKAMVGYYEDVLIFSKTHDAEAIHPLRKYSELVRKYTNYTRKSFRETLGHTGAQHFMESNKESSQFGLCTEETYEELIKTYEIDRMEGFIAYDQLLAINKRFNSTFNLWEGGKYKSNILRYKKDYNGYHPTQKPVLLLEDLIKTFSNEGDTVVDLTAGSGSTLVAAKNTNRNYIGIELNTDYFNIARNRIKEAQEVLV